MSADYKDNNIWLMKGDCLERMKEIPDGSVDMVITSPPYAMQRKSTYGGVSEDDYVEWFTPIALDIKRVLICTNGFVSTEIKKPSLSTGVEHELFRSNNLR